MDVDRLIAEVKKRPPLYDTKLPLYSNKNEKEQLWAEVTKAITRDWDNLHDDHRKIEVRLVQRRWRNIRDCFMKELKLQREGTPSGAKRKKYLFFDQLQFLLPSLDTKSFVSMNASGEAEEEAGSYDEPSSDIGSNEPPEKVKRGKQAATKSTEDNNSFEKNLLELLQKKSIPPKLEKLDADEMFLMSLAPTLRKLREEQKLMARIELIQVLHKYLCPEVVRDNMQYAGHFSFPSTSSLASVETGHHDPYQNISPTSSRSEESTRVEETNNYPIVVLKTRKH